MLQLHKSIKLKMQERFDIINVPRNITINDLCLSNVINLVSAMYFRVIWITACHFLN